MGLFTERGIRTAVLDRALHRRTRATTGTGDRYVAIAERVAAGEDATVACSLVGRNTAREGADLGEALDGLRSTTGQAAGRSPSFEEMRALALAWSEESLSYVHRLSCEDPLTGLAGSAHLRARLTEVYRGAHVRGEDPSRRYALVVIDMMSPAFADPFNQALWWVRLSESVRESFPGEETMCSVGRDLLVLLVERTDDLGARITDLRLGLGDALPEGGRLWIEGLPREIETAACVLDELLRR